MRDDEDDSSGGAMATDADEEQQVDEATNLPSKLIYEVIRRAGEEELARPTNSLLWSGIAAGMMISFSMIGEAVLRTYLPDVPSSYLIENLGYSLGFVIVILGRMQLFTENTITTVLPVVSDPSPRQFARLGRLWSIVLAANVVGAMAAAAFVVHTPALPGTLTPAIFELAHHVNDLPSETAFWRAIPAGILVAAIVWTTPQSRSAALWLVVLLTWIIAAGDFSHVVAGTVEIGVLIIDGRISVWSGLTGFFLPVLAGNVIGGTLVFTLIAWAQVRDEVEDSQ